MNKYPALSTSWKLVAVLAAIAMLAAACASPAAPSAPAAPAVPAAPAATAPPATPKGGTLRVAVQSDITPKTPHRTLEANYPWMLAVYDTLTRYDDQLRPQPVLAESWEWSGDKKLTLKLRKGVKFHNGRELTADDVEWNLRHLADAKANSQMKPTMDKIDTFEKPDANTLVINFKKPAPDFYDTTERMVIVDPKAIDGIENGSGGQVGTGPFIWKEWVPAGKLVLERNPNYWQAGLPNVDKIEYSIVPNRDTMTMSLEAGSVDLIVTPDAKDVLRMQKDSKYRILASANQTPIMYVGVNVKDKPYDDPRFRQALNFAMPRQRFAETILLGLTSPMTLPWPKVSPAYDDKAAQTYVYNLDKARELLKASGVTPGPLTIEYNTGQAELKQFAILYEQELNTLGFKVTLEPVEPANFATKNTGKQFKNLWMGVAEGAALYPATLLTNNNPWRAGDNTSNFRSPAYEDLVAKASTELDPAKQKDLFNQINKVMLDESFNMPITNQPYYWVMTAKVDGMQYNKSNMILFTRVAISK